MNDLNDIYEKLGRIEGIQTQLLQEVKSGFARINGSVKEHDKRIDKLDQESARNKGVAAGISMVVSVLVAVVTFFIKGK